MAHHIGGFASAISWGDIIDQGDNIHYNYYSNSRGTVFTPTPVEPAGAVRMRALRSGLPCLRAHVHLVPHAHAHAST